MSGASPKVSVPGLTDAIEGNGPVVMLGANGSGKTRLAAQMARESVAEFVPALRVIAVPDQLPSWSPAQAATELSNRTKQRLNAYWDLVSDADALFGKLFSSHSQFAVQYLNDARKGKASSTIPDTVLDQTTKLWQAVFPGRAISFDDFAPRVTSEYSNTPQYGARQMSDGERTGLYLAARVLDTEKHLIVVDEPETHFHSRLAVRFWDALESMSPDKRFVYATHDLNFALSRRDATLVLIRPKDGPEIVRAGETLASNDIASILGAASFSVYARRLVFCEGKEEKSLDQELLRAWFADRDTALIPVGSCESVRRCTAAFQQSRVVSGFQAIGIVDRDHWPNESLQSSADLFVLPFHEIESLYVLPAVFLSIAAHMGKASEAEGMYRRAFEEFKRTVKPHCARLIYERFRARWDLVSNRRASRPKDFSDTSRVRDEALAAITQAMSSQDAGETWAAEEAVVNGAIESAEPPLFLRIFPGKPLVAVAAKELGLRPDAYCELVKTGLGTSEGSMAQLSADLEAAFVDHLPARRLAD